MGDEDEIMNTLPPVAKQLFNCTLRGNFKELEKVIKVRPVYLSL
jgi:hypothetical protein